MPVQLDVGSWGLFCGQGGRQLVLVDDEPCGPVSARKITRPIPRRLLLDQNRVTQAYQQGSTRTETVTHADAEWTVALLPVVSPRSATVIGVLAAVTEADRALPEPPLIGCWEWEIERHSNGQPTSHRRTYWDRNLFRIYDVDPGIAQQRQDQGYWEAGEWANGLIDQADQMRLSASIRDSVQDGLNGITGTLRCLTYSVVTGYGSTSQGRRHLRLVGQVVPVGPDDDKIVLQGLSYDAPPTFQDLALEQDAARVDDVLRGVMQLAGDPIAVVDASTLDVLMTSQSWRRAGFGHVGGLGDFADSSPGELRAFIAAAAAASETEQPRTMAANLRRVDGSVQRVRMTVTGVRSGVQGRDVVIKLDL
ncbi:hypothetical protein C8K30_1011035 [Promicromonospora sp. AC04]|uniref:hypothetical protein n=1 Tax=Promicromonospora sp. AC04 TaxID=2135723 RepID=UPI000D462B07|nr:hypothetical protein [Promicromonospora sp. AC04]PUB32509.1 hypothetical protein C8K30_1011035 [Promicromonospora sp. AC04]